ncbi:hypothetical protein VTK73DRAFT_3821 [Phialemonium thermophilum]|uniref:Uncharacterized protein n=1 Tax=Phialemonium thermophilum TaxID=223376 RepID=A0ABR3VEB3_9PEZI
MPRSLPLHASPVSCYMPHNRAPMIASPRRLLKASTGPLSSGGYPSPSSHSLLLPAVVAPELPTVSLSTASHLPRLCPPWLTVWAPLSICFPPCITRYSRER